ncbi:MAG: SurA N-terminal domain-containing protein [Akkermansiaceae bacterium]|jgi:parvulin-like peptidyl-prolyl isomerase|nr:SurA N-terminal domain-containing protein [Akkermansiaceae bacterium]
MKSCSASALVLAASLLPLQWTSAQLAPIPGAPTIPAAPGQQAAPRPVARGPVEVNGIAAKVNGSVITKNQVSFMMSPIYAQLATQFPRRGPQFEAQFNEAKTKILQELIDRQIILDEFKQLGASIKPNIIDEEIKRQMRDLYNGSEVKFREELQRSRLTMEGYRKMTREKMVVQAMRANQFADAPPPLPNEVQKEYNEVKLTLRDVTKDVVTFQKIFIPASDADNPVATPETQLTLAEGIAKELSDGKDFAEIAKANSKDAFADKGGLQENVPRIDLSPEFASIIFEAPVGKIIGPLLDPQGFTIAKVIKIDYGPSPPLDKVRDMIEERVRKKKTSAQYDRWIESRRKRAMIDIRI